MDVVEFVRYSNAVVALAACFFWAVSGVRRSALPEMGRLENTVTFLVGALIFVLAAASYDAARGADPRLRVFAVLIVLTALTAVLAYAVLVHDRRRAA